MCVCVRERERERESERRGMVKEAVRDKDTEKERWEGVGEEAEYAVLHRYLQVHTENGEKERDRKS